MNFKIDKRLFNGILNTVSKAISSSAPIPALSGVKISVSEEKVTFIGSDSNISIKVVKKPSEDLIIVEEGEIVIDIKYISEIVRKMDSDIINVELIDGTLCRISGNNSEFKINGMRPSDYPNINFDHNTDSFKIKTSQLINMVQRTIFACSDQQVRQVLTGLNLKLNNQVLIASGTDSYRLSAVKSVLNSDLSFNITIPSKLLSETCNIISEKEEVEIFVSDTKVFFKTEDTLILTRLIEDAFPNTDHLLNVETNQRLEISGKELQDAVDRTLFIKSDGRSVVKLKIDADSVEVTSSSQEIGSSHEKLSIIKYEGEPLVISCSGKYLSDAIKALRSENIVMLFRGSTKPIIIKADNGEDIIEYISPVRSYD